MNKKILCVDDDVNILASFQRTLRGRFIVDTATSGEAGLARIDTDGPYAVILADMNMPHMDGVQFLMKAKVKAPDSVRIMLTKHADQHIAVDAVNLGSVFQFLSKPCQPDRLARTLAIGVRQHHLIIAERELLENTLNGSIKVLADVLAMTNPHAFGEAKQARNYIRSMAVHLEYENLWELELAATLAQIGLVTIPPDTIEKRRAGMRLSGSEEEMFKKVPELGSELIKNIPRLENVAAMVRFQDKQFNGEGLPAEHVAGSEIPVGARLLKVAVDLSRFQTKLGGTVHAVAHMRTLDGWYDPEMLAAAEVCFGHDDAGRTESTPGVRLRVRELNSGDILIKDIATSDGIVLASAGTIVTPILTEKLANFAQLVEIDEYVLIERPPIQNPATCS